MGAALHTLPVFYFITFEWLFTVDTPVSICACENHDVQRGPAMIPTSYSYPETVLGFYLGRLIAAGILTTVLYQLSGVYSHN